MERLIARETMSGNKNINFRVSKFIIFIAINLTKNIFYRLFGTKCDKCGSSFSKNDFVMRAKTKVYHIECFRCSACARQLIPGKYSNNTKKLII